MTQKTKPSKLNLQDLYDRPAGPSFITVPQLLQHLVSGWWQTQLHLKFLCWHHHPSSTQALQGKVRNHRSQQGKSLRATGGPRRDGAGGLGLLPGGVQASFHHSALKDLVFGAGGHKSLWNSWTYSSYCRTA